MSDQHHFDFLVIGSGIAGLCYALRVAEHGTVGIVTKRDAADSATNQAQGGIAAVLDPTDSFEEHVADTLTAGAGLCKESVVRHVVERGPAAIEALLEHGVQFDRDESGRDGAGTAPPTSLSGARAATPSAASCTAATPPARRSRSRC